MQAQPATETMRLERLRGLHARSGAGRLQLACAGRTLMLYGTEPVSGEDGPIASFEAHVDYELVEFLAGAWEATEFLLALVDRAARTVRSQRARIAELEEQNGWYKKALDQAGEPSIPPEASGASSSMAPAAGELPAAGRPAGPPQGSAAGAVRPSGDSQKDYSAEAAMKCADTLFAAFLRERARDAALSLSASDGNPSEGDPDTPAALLRALLAIPSRRDLNTDPAAASRWRDLKADFEAWRTHG
jgi:hypothetical protein